MILILITSCILFSGLLAIKSCNLKTDKPKNLSQMYHSKSEPVLNLDEKAELKVQLSTASESKSESESELLLKSILHIPNKHYPVSPETKWGWYVDLDY